MPKEPDQISPEERLLNVIQKGESDKKERKATPLAAQVPDAPEPLAMPAAAASQKAKLSLVKEAPDAQLRQGASVSVEPARPASPGQGSTAPAARNAQRFMKASYGKTREKWPSLKPINLGLVAVTVIVAILTAFQIHAGVASFRADRQPATMAPPAGVDAPMLVAVPEAPDISAFLAALDSRPFFPGTPGDETGKKTDLTGGWALDVRDNVNMIGISRVSGGEGEFEAILVDKRDGKMHLAKVGDTITFGKKELRVDQVSGEETVLTDGTEKVSVR